MDTLSCEDHEQRPAVRLIDEVRECCIWRISSNSHASRARVCTYRWLICCMFQKKRNELRRRRTGAAEKVTFFFFLLTLGPSLRIKARCTDARRQPVTERLLCVIAIPLHRSLACVPKFFVAVLSIYPFFLSSSSLPPPPIPFPGSSLPSSSDSLPQDDGSSSGSLRAHHQEPLIRLARCHRDGRSTSWPIGFSIGYQCSSVRTCRRCCCSFSLRSHSRCGCSRTCRKWLELEARQLQRCHCLWC